MFIDSSWEIRKIYFSGFQQVIGRIPLFPTIQPQKRIPRIIKQIVICNLIYGRGWAEKTIAGGLPDSINISAIQPLFCGLRSRKSCFVTFESFLFF